MRAGDYNNCQLTQKRVDLCSNIENKKKLVNKFRPWEMSVFIQFLSLILLIEWIPPVLIAAKTPA